MIDIDTSFSSEHLEFLDSKIRERTGISDEELDDIRDQKALQPDYPLQTA